MIGGFGRVGQTLARLLDAENVPYVAFDTDGELVTKLGKTTPHVFLGDASRAEMLERLHGARTRAFVVTVNEPQAAERMVRAARRINPDAPVLARAADPAHAVRLLRLGAIEGDPRSRRSEPAARRARPRGARHVGGRGGTPNRPGACRGAQPLTAELDGKR